MEDLRADKQRSERRIRSLEDEVTRLRTAAVVPVDLPPDLPVTVVQPNSGAVVSGESEDWEVFEEGDIHAAVAEAPAKRAEERNAPATPIAAAAHREPDANNGKSSLAAMIRAPKAPSAPISTNNIHQPVANPTPIPMQLASVTPPARTGQLEPKPTTLIATTVRTAPATFAPAVRAEAPATVQFREPKARYNEAMRLLREGSGEASRALFKSFVTDFPRHDLTDNAQYWLAETYYHQKQYDAALAEFRAVRRFRNANKTPDAMLKEAYCLLALGMTNDGRQVLADLATAYKDSAPAELARQRLEAIK